LWEAATGRAIGGPLLHSEAVKYLAFSPDGQTLLVGGFRNRVQLWDVSTGKSIGPGFWQSGVHGVAFRSDSRIVTTNILDGILAWDMPSPLQGEVDRIVLWTQVLTSLELDAAGSIRQLDSSTWQDRRRRLEQLGGLRVP
jgi:WD40 repeat protein